MNICQKFYALYTLLFVVYFYMRAVTLGLEITWLGKVFYL